ncbi:MAG: multiprotein bridging factor aMBF1 [Candidatus Micrarchaeia archaeon]
MEECELCGKKTDKIYVIEVDGVELGVCASCAKGKKVMKEPAIPLKVQSHKTSGKAASEAEAAELADDYGKRIQSAREKLGLSLPVLAEMINEKESHMLRVEQQKTLPTPELVKKLEKVLGIKLTSVSEDSSPSRASHKEEHASIGDFIEKQE